MSQSPLDIARSPAAPPNLLLKLVREGDDVVRAAVAANPAAPGPALAALCERFAPQVLANPGLLLVLMTDPTFFATLSSTAALAVIRQEPLGELVLASLAGHGAYQVRVQAALHLSADASLWRRLSTDANPFVRRAVGSRSRCPADVLAALAADRDPFPRSGVAMNAACPPALLEALERDDDAGVRAVVAARRAR